MIGLSQLVVQWWNFTSLSWENLIKFTVEAGQHRSSWQHRLRRANLWSRHIMTSALLQD